MRVFLSLRSVRTSMDRIEAGGLVGFGEIRKRRTICFEYCFAICFTRYSYFLGCSDGIGKGSRCCDDVLEISDSCAEKMIIIMEKFGFGPGVDEKRHTQVQVMHRVYWCIPKACGPKNVRTTVDVPRT